MRTRAVPRNGSSRVVTISNKGIDPLRPGILRSSRKSPAAKGPVRRPSGPSAPRQGLYEKRNRRLSGFCFELRGKKAATGHLSERIDVAGQN